MRWGGRRWRIAEDVALVHWAEATASYRSLSGPEARALAARLMARDLEQARRIVETLRMVPCTTSPDRLWLERELEALLMLEDRSPRRRSLNRPADEQPPRSAPPPPEHTLEPSWMAVRVVDEIGHCRSRG